MEQLIPVIRFEVWILLGSLALVVAYKMLSGPINMKGLREARVLDVEATGSAVAEEA